MVEPLACVLRGIHETGIQPGDTTVVIGCGPDWIEIYSRAGQSRRERDCSRQAAESDSRSGKIWRARGLHCAGFERRGANRSGIDGRRARSRFRGGSRGYFADLGSGLCKWCAAEEP